MTALKITSIGGGSMHAPRTIACFVRQAAGLAGSTTQVVTAAQ